MNRNLLSKNWFGLLLLFVLSPYVNAQITGKYGTYYDQRELLFESLPTSENDIIFLGNSITDGGEWCELFQNVYCKNRGISADVTEGVLNRLETITKGQPAMVFIMIGTNDMNWGISNDSVALGVREIVQRIKNESPRTKIVVQSILPTNDCYGYFLGHTKRYKDVAVINDMLKTMSEEEGVTYLDLYSRFANEEGKLNTDYSNDGLHINGAGYQVWKNAIEEEIGRLPQPLRKTKASVWLNGGAGYNFNDTYDNGAAALSMLGFGLNYQTGATVEWGRCHLQQEVRALFDILIDPVEGYNIDAEERLEFLYRVRDSKRNRLHLWVGGSLQMDAFFKIIPSLGNASTSSSLFGNLCAEGMALYDFAFIRNGSHNLLSAYGKLILPIGGLIDRPGYSFMDNYTSSISLTSTILSSYETTGMLFPGVSTDIGIRLNLLNGNKIGCSYRWDYLTTRNRGYYRFDNAFHTFTIDFMFKLN